MRKTQSTIYK